MAALNGVPSTPGATTPPTNPTGGLVAALDAWSGNILWTFANPMTQLGDATKNALSQAPVTVANGAAVPWGVWVCPNLSTMMLCWRAADTINCVPVTAANGGLL